MSFANFGKNGIRLCSTLDVAALDIICGNHELHPRVCSSGHVWRSESNLVSEGTCMRAKPLSDLLPVLLYRLLRFARAYRFQNVGLVTFEGRVTEKR
jgi:hypothetical protein